LTVNVNIRFEITLDFYPGTNQYYIL